MQVAASNFYRFVIVFRNRKTLRFPNSQSVDGGAYIEPFFHIFVYLFIRSLCWGKDRKYIFDKQEISKIIGYIDKINGELNEIEELADL